MARKQSKKPSTFALQGIKQGVGRATNRAFGNTRPKRNGRKPRNGAGRLAMSVMDAFSPAHMPLPRAIGPYTVVRTTQIFTPVDAVSLWGPTGQGAGTDESWSTVVGFGSVNSTLPINATGNARAFQILPLRNNAWVDSKAVPAAYSIQVMNPGALQTTTGTVYMGRLRTVPRITGDTRTWDEFGNECVNYNQPRLLAAAKLAMRGVQVDAVPMNMSQLADFKPIEVPVQTTRSYTFTFDINRACQGFGPIFIYNPNFLSLQVLVSVEWRVRFDPSNPAQATHTHHQVATDSQWGSLLRTMEAGAHGVREICETAAAVGSVAAPLLAAV